MGILSKAIQRVTVIGLTALMLQLPTPAHAVMSEAQVTSKIEDTFDVKVLEILRSTKLDPGIIAVKMMNSPGSSNNKFQVYTIFVNEETGDPVPLYGEFVSRLPRTSPLIWQRTFPFTVDDNDHLDTE